jgi:geranylgeranyl diphosphate synthase type I
VVSAGRTGRNLIDADLADAFESYLREFVDAASRAHPVYAHIAYHLGYAEPGPARRGKRLRPRLVIAAAAACGGSMERALPACAAVELLHNYSLIHDDIEDGDRLRHGRETVWSAFGLPHGVNAGDAVGALATLALAPVGAVHGYETAMAMAMDLASANARMCEGQSLDLAFEAGEAASVDAYIDMIGGKTAALFACAGSLGARSAAAQPADIERCADVGRLFGLAFQIEDDAHGIWGDSGSTGKSIDSDLSRRKKSYPVVWAIEHDPVRAGRAIAEAFAKPSTVLDTTVVEGLRNALESAGARDAAMSASRDCFARALARAAGREALESFLEQWRDRR